MKIILLVVAALLFGACTPLAVREYNAWSAVEKPRAERSEIKWSDYYKESYDKISKSPDGTENKGVAMELHSFMITAALAHESGKIDKETFDGIRRTNDAQWQKAAETANAARSVAIGKALQNYGNARYGPEATKAQQMQIQPQLTYEPPKQIQCSTYGKQMNCTQY